MSEQEPLILGIETAGREGSLAVVRGRMVLAERKLETAGRRHAQTLVAELAQMCADMLIEPREVSAVGVSIGPGSFTGLRVGCTVAKSLCYVTNAKLLAVDSLQASAVAWGDRWDHVWAVEDAQRGELFVGKYEQNASGFALQGGIQIVQAQAWLAGLSSSDVILGPGLLRLNSLSTAATRIEESVAPPPARIVAQLTQKLFDQEAFSDPWTIEPFYVRLSAAEEKAAAANT